MKKESIFTRRKFVVLFALIAVFLWGCAYPLIKLGMIEFAIENSDTPGKTLFAGVRFLIAGMVTLLIGRCSHCDFHIKEKRDWVWILLFGFVNTALHYFCFYVGLSNCSGSKSSILNSMGSFLLIILACMIFPSEHMTRKKVLGCIVGFTGILILNLGDGGGAGFSFWGEGMIMLNALCSAFGGIITRVITRRVNAIVATGYSLAIGGVMLIAAGVVMGGALTVFTPKGILILAMLVVVSSGAFSLYNQLLSHNPVGEVAIFNSLIPVFGLLLSCIFLGEAFYVKYIIAGIFVADGVYILNR